MFNSDILASRLYAVCEMITNIVIVTILFFLFSLPIFTIGASMTALITVLRNPEFKVFNLFIKTFKENFLRSIVVMIFTIFSIMFITQIRVMTTGVPAGNIIYFVILSFVVAYNLNIFVLLNVLNKCNLSFFRQVFFFTIGTFYKGFFVPLIAAVLVIVTPIIGGVPLLMMSLSLILMIYLKMIRKDLETVEELLQK